MPLKIQKYQLLFVLISILYVSIAYLGIPNNNFIYSGDQYFPLSKMEINKNFLSINISKDLGLIDGYGIVLNFWDSLYYKLFYLVSNNVVLANKINIFLYTYLGLTLAYTGFNKWNEYLYQNESNLPIYITLFYIFGPYTLMLSHGGVFNITNALTYALAPLTFYLFYKQLTADSINKEEYIRLSLLLMIQTFQFWMFFTYFIVLSLFFILYFTINTNKKIILKRIFILTTFYLPISLVISYPVIYQFINNTNTINATFSPVFGNMQGGIWYQMKMLHSWGIYTVWEPRAMYSFGKYFFSDRYNLIIIVLWLTIFTGIIKIIFFSKITTTIFSDNKLYSFKFKSPSYSENTKPVIKLTISITLLLIIAIFFSKGSQKPFGEIFLWLYENVSLFKIFRTPDIRFGFIIILLVSTLLLIISSKIPQQFLKTLILLFIVITSWPHILGVGLRGENIPGKYYDRVISISEDYRTAANYLNNSSTNYVYINPNQDYAVFKIDNDYYVGQDIFGKLLKSPLYYGGEESSIKKNTYEKFKNINDNINIIDEFPISHVVLRNDLKENNLVNEAKIEKKGKLVFQNNTFKIYHINNNTSILNKDYIEIDNNLYYLYIDDNNKIKFLNSYDNHWYLVGEEYIGRCKMGDNFLCKIILKIAISKTLITNNSGKLKPELLNNYAMQWDVEKKPYYLVYYPQVIFDLLLIIFILLLLIYLIIQSAKKSFSKYRYS